MSINVTTEPIGQLVSAIKTLLTHRQVHKLGGVALAVYGLVVGDFDKLTLGAAYAAAMHITGGLKGIPDSTSTVVATTSKPQDL